MATKKISELTALASPAGTEELVVNDGGTSKKITQTNLLSTALPLAGGTMTGALTTTGFTSTGIDDNATSTAITIDANEDIAIGVGAITIHGYDRQLQIEGTNNAHLVLAGGANEFGLAYNGGAVLRNYANTSMSFYTNSVKYLEITNDGRGLSQFTAKAWVNFNGTGTVAIRDSHNVSSITDTGTGSYTINFSNNLGNTSYSAVSANSDTEANGASLSPSVFNVGSLSVASRNGSGTLIDGSKLNATVFGD